MTVDAAEQLLSDPSCAATVHAVLRRVDELTYRASNAAGSLTWQRLDDGFEIVATSGESPFGERHPHALDSASQIFDDRLHAGDLAVSLRTSHRKGDAGDHGSLDIDHATAPFVVAGAGVEALGRVDLSLRMIDVAPTLCSLLGTALAGADGTVCEPLVGGETAGSVVVFLLDGLNAEVLDGALAAGGAPNIAALADQGSHLLGGVLASYPTATLANHSAALTGRHPGRSGVVHHAWWDRAGESSVNLLDYDQMFAASDHLTADTETVHEAVHRQRPDAFTVTTFEYADRGADWSTFAHIRRGERVPGGGPRPTRHLDPEWGEHEWYAWLARVDQASVRQSAGFWQGDTPVPDFAFVNLNLTDKAGHMGGPDSPEVRAALAETDARIGEVIDAIDGRGTLGSTAFVVMSDHGMALTEPHDRPALAELLAGEGIDALVVDETFVYLR